ncbi:MAG: hypothetical protein KKH94_02630 [Candidatus Omnitrophica bacterium]|nr:hypothetical protein [Candidatus Omnitrophota bacterium]
MKSKTILFILCCFLFSGCASWQERTTNWNDVALWRCNSDGDSSISLNSKDDIFEMTYQLKGQHGWVEIQKNIVVDHFENRPIVFRLRAVSPSDLEIKCIDHDGSVFGRKISLKGKYREWTEFVVYSDTVEYWWGGDEHFDGLVSINFAISGQGTGVLFLDDIRFGSADLLPTLPPAGPQLDPDGELDGLGFKARRHDVLIPEDPLVLEYLKQLQDISSPEKQLVPSQEDMIAQTFNNAIVAMAFILKGERARAERILDFYANATDANNTNVLLQNFFYNGEARGFYQNMLLRDMHGRKKYHTPKNGDRWVGDMAWLLLAYQYYEKQYTVDRYREVMDLLKDLLIRYFVEDGHGGGYVEDGWRRDDSMLHENHGHAELNIDCYAVFNLCGEHVYGEKIKNFLDRVLGTKTNLWLDQYTWRVLTFGKEYKDLLNIPEYDLRFRKTLEINGEPVIGFFHSPDIAINNMWLDGTGHMACAFMATGNRERGYFYANQLDHFMIDREIGGLNVRALPYTANKTGGYLWVDPHKGFVSVAAWYLFAKNKFNPMTLERLK